jgi:hypothetical protein
VSAPAWPVVIRAELDTTVRVGIFTGMVTVGTELMDRGIVAFLTSEQSATLRAALEAAESEMK